MSEPVARQRPYLDDRERRTTMTSGGHEDPLAELARLVGREDPFRDIFPARAPAAQRPVMTDREPPDLIAERYIDHDDRHSADLPPAEPQEAHEADELAAYEAYLASQPREPVTEVQRDSLRFPVIPAGRDDYATPRLEDFDETAAQQDAPPLHADLWAEGVQDTPPGDAAEYLPAAEEVDPAETGHSKRRTLIVLAAVIALTGGGLAATYFVKGGSHSAASSGTAPTIMADSAPTKVQPPETSNAATGGDGNTALLEKSASDNVANAKVVNAQERPVDLAQLPQAAEARALPQAADPAATAADHTGTTAPQTGTTFPEPRKVKTILIRPDGSVVGEAPAAQPSMASPATPGVVMPEPASPPPAVAALTPTPVAKPATPKTTARATTTPKSLPAATAARTPPKSKPVETAAAEPAQEAPAAAPSGGGAYAVQLAAPPSEVEAKSTLARLQKKFDALASYKTSIHKADSGNKSVYRVRVGNLSQDDAKSLCSKLQASGGSCFVVHN